MKTHHFEIIFKGSDSSTSPKIIISNHQVSPERGVTCIFSISSTLDSAPTRPATTRGVLRLHLFWYQLKFPWKYRITPLSRIQDFCWRNTWFITRFLKIIIFIMILNKKDYFWVGHLSELSVRRLSFSPKLTQRQNQKWFRVISKRCIYSLTLEL